MLRGSEEKIEKWLLCWKFFNENVLMNLLTCRWQLTNSWNLMLHRSDVKKKVLKNTYQKLLVKDR